MDINGNIPEKWNSYVTQQGKGLEVVPDVLYSTVNYVSTTTTILSFFDFANASRPDLTNLLTASQLPNPESFLIQAIRVHFQSNLQSDVIGAANAALLVSSFEDIVKLSNNGVLRLKIGQKNYGPWPLWMLPAGSSVQGQTGGGSPTSTLTYGQIMGPFLYSLFPNLMLAPLQQFGVTIEWPGGAQTLSNTPLAIQVMFDGQHARAIS